jgi:hypothetical protein
MVVMSFIHVLSILLFQARNGQVEDELIAISLSCSLKCFKQKRNKGEVASADRKRSFP